MKKLTLIIASILLIGICAAFSDTIENRTAYQTQPEQQQFVYKVLSESQTQRQELIKELLWNYVPIVAYLIGGLFALFGVIFRWGYKSINAIKNNINTPKKFSAKYFFLEKLPRKLLSLLVAIIAAFICMRFSDYIFGVKFTMFFCFLIGLFLDKLISLLYNIKISKLLKFNPEIANNTNDERNYGSKKES